eukprot:gnl/MRDRNA2_/MRDRNA2_56768_c0_seq1.p1 gnl/MRDRNA2_/MRDRNA2_56768_c0~~gnl/MRDRNA2_/MRDRNA2_56768_c0_seq1.p1  ORF type:complete len:210 (+),score=51.05 gnl/MRDRNA2_/MRDRNA2_56768_c0_seq1:60-689(+)
MVRAMNFGTLRFMGLRPLCWLFAAVAPLNRSILPGALAVREGPTQEQVPELLLEGLKVFAPGATTAAKDVEQCLPEGAKTGFVDRIHKVLEYMLQQKRKPMRLGLKNLGVAFGALVEDAEAKCTSIKLDGAKELHAAASALKEFGSAKANIEYKKLKTLKVGGIDVHKDLNKWIGTWKKEPKDFKPADCGKALGEFIKKFGKGDKKDEL